jgi:hypothetical protein
MSISTCGPFTYSATLSGGSSLPTMISFDPATKTFSVDETLITTTMTYTIEIFGSLPSPGSSDTTTF